MTGSRLSRVAVVLVEPQDPVNIAATVRAMKNMGVSDLRLVRPVAYEPDRLEGIAHNTRDLIDRIQTFDSFDEAVAGCVRLAGFTARRRAAKWRIVDPKQAASELLAPALFELGDCPLNGLIESRLPFSFLLRRFFVE